MSVVKGANREGTQNEARLAEELAALVLGWKSAPGRFLKTGRSWIPHWRFQPFMELGDAFQLLDQAGCQYTLRYNGRTFTAEVRTPTGRGIASGEQKARTISLAVARALGVRVD